MGDLSLLKMLPSTFHSPFTRVHASTNLPASAKRPLFSGDVGLPGATTHARGGGEGEDQAVAKSPSQREPTAGVGSNSGVCAVPLTRSRIHIPAAPCPGTPQAIR